MRRLLRFTLPLMLLAIVVAPRQAFCQTGPGPSTGGLTATLQPDAGGPAAASVLRGPSADLLVTRRWMVESFTVSPRAAARPSFKARRSAQRRNPVWVP